MEHIIIIVILILIVFNLMEGEQIVNHLYRLGPSRLRDGEDYDLDMLWCCAYSPYILCKKCPLYHGIKPKHSKSMQESLTLTTNRYSLYGLIDDMCDNAEIPSKRCRNTPWRNMRPVEEVIHQTTEIT